MMLLALKGADGGTVIVNTDTILYIGQAVDPDSKQPLLGHSAIIFGGGFAIGPDRKVIQQSMLVRGTPAEIAELITNAQGYPIEAHN